ncbi:hypothetical protein CEXT_238621 [Caerostris extrusa]|uniref:Uncharacterized protein n=1 Tax=Caerostris extrusa TaxID=172846 RepID=A0AAV4PBV4_CAEEX|nr:hypothetical protein CEXT_238621 [Caerostris extrusa]
MSPRSNFNRRLPYFALFAVMSLLYTLFHSQQIIAPAQLVRLSYGLSVKQQMRYREDDVLSDNAQGFSVCLDRLAERLFDYDILTGLVYGYRRERREVVSLNIIRKSADAATALTTGAVQVDMMPSAISASLSRLSFEMAKICERWWAVFVKIKILEDHR